LIQLNEEPGTGARSNFSQCAPSLDAHAIANRNANAGQDHLAGTPHEQHVIIAIELDAIVTAAHDLDHFAVGRRSFGESHLHGLVESFAQSLPHAACSVGPAGKLKAPGNPS
jgi:hypothetical protein